MKIGPKPIGSFLIVALICGIVDGIGWYFQSIYNFSRAFVTGRYGSFQPDAGDWISQFTFGAGYVIVDGVETRFETLVNSHSDDNKNTLQMVASF